MLLELLIQIVAPHSCISCNREGALLCRSCQNKLPGTDGCVRCKDVSVGSCRARGVSNLNHLYTHSAYQGLAKELVQRLKFGSTPAAAEHIAMLLASLSLGAVDAVVPVCTSPRRYRQRGYDQTVLIARCLARQLHRPLYNVLLRSGTARQLGAGRHQRLRQPQGHYTVKPHTRIKNVNILLVDDVRTTGATLEAAAAALVAAGAKSVNGLVFAQA